MPYTAGYAIADIAALKALTTADLVDGYARWVISTNNWYGWNANSSATANDDSVISITEAPEVGRFLRAGFIEELTESDPSFNNVVLLLHFDGANNSTVFTDVKGKTIIPDGNAAISTAQSKFGGASGYFDGSGDYLSIPKTSLDLSSFSVWTFELWVYPTSTNQGIIFTNYNLNAGKQVGCFLLRTNVTLYVAGAALETPFSLNVNTWSHIAVTKNNLDYATYINGQLAGYGDVTNVSPASSNMNYFGGSPGDNNIGNQWFEGYIDEVRFTKNVLRYTSNFTVLDLPFPDS